MMNLLESMALSHNDIALAFIFLDQVLLAISVIRRRYYFLDRNLKYKAVTLLLKLVRLVLEYEH